MPLKIRYAITMDHSWSPRDKAIARRAYDEALANAKKEIFTLFKEQSIASTDDLWDLEEWIREQRKEMSSIFIYSYSKLELVFCISIRRGWLKLESLEGLSPPIFESIKRIVSQ
jgi:hypothetical protein